MFLIERITEMHYFTKNWNTEATEFSKTYLFSSNDFQFTKCHLKLMLNLISILQPNFISHFFEFVLGRYRANQIIIIYNYVIIIERFYHLAFLLFCSYFRFNLWGSGSLFRRTSSCCESKRKKIHWKHNN